MSIFTKDQIVDASGTDGIWVDYTKHTWLFFVKDRVWDKEEIRAAYHRELKISFVSKGILDLFLLEIDDCLEPSDLPFCIKDADEELTSSLDDSIPYGWEIVFLSENGTVVMDRAGDFTKEDSAMMKKVLKEHLAQEYTGEDFDKAYAKNSMRYEPYEFESSALFSEKCR